MFNNVNPQSETQHPVQIQSESIFIHGQDTKAQSFSVNRLVHLALEGKISREELPAYLDMIGNQLDATIFLIENLIQGGRAQIRYSGSNAQSVSVSPVIAEVFTLLQPNAASKNIMLTNNTFQNVNVPVSKGVINFMIRNLVNNSIKFTNEGQIEVVSETDNEWLYISVKDSGIGMTGDQVEKILNSSCQPESGTHNESGSGMGLMLVHEFIQQLQGGMTINSIPDKGTTIKLSIPLNN